MEDFLNTIHSGNIQDPPEQVRKAFRRYFRQAVNAEWYHDVSGYEVIFHENNMEKIALFDFQAELIHYEENRPLEDLPSFLQQELPVKGKIMSHVVRNEGGTIFHEVIIRDKDWKRFVLEFDESGMLIKTLTL